MKAMETCCEAEVLPPTLAVDSQHAEIDSSPPAILNAIDQDILRVTLHGPALLLTIFILTISVHLLHPSLTTLLISLAPLPYIIHNDYKAFLSLGPGGTPSTWAGYVKITYLRLFVLSDPYKPPPTLGTICPSTGRFTQSPTSVLPIRRGPRPRIAGIAPQRQLNQPGDARAYFSVRTALIDAARHSPSRLRIGVSCFEKAGLALFAKAPLNNTCNGEIVHVHHSDRSMHMNLHPEDAKVVLERGWGQRHPLAKGGWLGRYVPREFVMVYAPRDRGEVEAVARIMEAAAWWVMGERVEIVVSGGGSGENGA